VTWICNHEAVVGDHEESLQWSSVSSLVLDGLEQLALRTLSTCVILLTTRPARAVAKCNGWFGALPVFMSAATVGATAGGARPIACSPSGSSFTSWSLLALLKATAAAAVASTTFPLVDCGDDLVGVSRRKGGHEFAVAVAVVVVVAVVAIASHG